MAKKKRKNKPSQSVALTDNAKDIRKKKDHAVILVALVLWTVVCIGFYYFSIEQRLLWVIHLYMGIGIPSLAAAILINGYFNAKYTGAEEKPDPETVRKVKNTVKALMIAGLPPIFCVTVEFVVGRLIEKFIV